MNKQSAPNSLITHRIAVNMARIALKVLAPNDERYAVARKRLHDATEAQRVFIYKQKGNLTASGKLLRH